MQQKKKNQNKKTMEKANTIDILKSIHKTSKLVAIVCYEQIYILSNHISVLVKILKNESR